MTAAGAHERDFYSRLRTGCVSRVIHGRAGRICEIPVFFFTERVTAFLGFIRCIVLLQRLKPSIPIPRICSVSALKLRFAIAIAVGLLVLISAHHSSTFSSNSSSG